MKVTRLPNPFNEINFYAENNEQTRVLTFQEDKPAPLQGIARFRLYDLRHTWATRAAMSGVDLVTLANSLPLSVQ